MSKMTKSFKSLVRNPERPQSPPLKSGILDKVILMLEILNLAYKLIITYCATKAQPKQS